MATLAKQEILILRLICAPDLLFAAAPINNFIALGRLKERDPTGYCQEEEVPACFSGWPRETIIWAARRGRGLRRLGQPAGDITRFSLRR